VSDLELPSPRSRAAHSPGWVVLSGSSEVGLKPGIAAVVEEAEVGTRKGVLGVSAVNEHGLCTINLDGEVRTKLLAQAASYARLRIAWLNLEGVVKG
jgi:hypothetical protein